MIRHGASHGLAYLISTIAAGLLVGLMSHYLPSLISRLDGFTEDLILRYEITTFDHEQLNILIVAAGLTTIWGMAFKFMHSDVKE